jgi:hypothetical protein
MTTPGATLRIEYQLLNENTTSHIVEFDFDEDTEVVLSEYTHMVMMA